jgi:protein-S-isoprenylcysteine O-methyltransferase Ste14
MMKQILPIIAALVVCIARVAELRTKRDVIKGPVRENLTFRLFVLTGTVMLIGSLIEYFARGVGLRPLPFVAGLCCAIASFVIRRKAIAALGKFWSLHVEIRENHQFVRTGPFRWVRHPTYFSMILELLSVALILNAFLMLLIIPFLFMPVLLWRLKLEEGALVEKFGETYRQYQENTPALIPYRWPAK